MTTTHPPTPPALVDEAIAAGVILYERPDTLDLAKIDPAIREAVARINASGWCFTGESCSGHPDATHKFVWGYNQPYLRLTTRRADMGRCLDLLSRAASGVQDEDGLAWTFGLKVYRYADKGDFSQVGVYLDAPTVWARDTAMRVFELFGDSLEAAVARRSPEGAEPPTNAATERDIAERALAWLTSRDTIRDVQLRDSLNEALQTRFGSWPMQVYALAVALRAASPTREPTP